MGRSLVRTSSTVYAGCTCDFNINKSTALHPSHHSRLQATPGPSPGNSDLATLTSVLLMDMVQERLSSRPTPIPSTPAPKEPANSTNLLNPSPVPVPLPTPSKLTCFLQYAEANLGVESAQTLEPALQRLGVGPDILSEMDDTLLCEAGISPGDIIRLKRGSIVWWNGPEAR